MSAQQTKLMRKISKNSYFKLIVFNELEKYGKRLLQLQYEYDNINHQPVYLCEIEYEENDK